MATMTLDPPIDHQAGTPVELGPERGRRLRVFNLVMAGIHLASGVAMIALGNNFTLPISSFSTGGPPGTPLSEGTLRVVTDVRLAWATAAFMLLSSLFHLIIAAPVGYPRYLSELRAGRNRFRWVEYSLSATLMIVLIAMITGISNMAALIAIAVTNASMILLGWIMEVVNQPGSRTWWTPFWFGCIAGAGPWAAIVATLAYNAAQPGAAQPPTFVYGIIVSIFVLFNCFAINQWLQYKRIGRWNDYVFGEVIYIVLSLVAKSALAWQIFANTLI